MQRMYDAVLQLVRLWDAAGIPYKPKMHLLVHMLQQTQFSGNPANYSTFFDEGLNKVLASVSRAAHRTVWELRIFAHMAQTEDRRVQRK